MYRFAALLLCCVLLAVAAVVAAPVPFPSAVEGVHPLGDRLGQASRPAWRLPPSTGATIG